MKQLLSVWLVPQKQDEKYLKNIINKLGKENNSPTFIPHLTLFGDINIELEKLKKVVDEVFSQTKSFKITQTKLNQSELFFKTIFIKFEKSNLLINLFEDLVKASDEKKDINTFKPHISLIYKLMPKNEKLKIIKKLDIKDEFTIGSVYINAPKIGDTDYHDVKSWRTLYKKTLI